MAEDSEKTEAPTSKRLGEARNKGDVARSHEVDTAFFLLCVFLLFNVAGGFLMDQMKLVVSGGFKHINYDLTVLSTQTLFMEYLVRFFYIFGPIALVMLFISFFSSYIQVGWIFTTEELKMNWNALFNPKGFLNLVSIESFKNLAKGLVKLSVVSFIIYLTIKKDLSNFMGLVDLSVLQIFEFTGRIILKIISNILYIYILIALGDFFWTKYLYIKKLKMSKTEVKDEFRQMEGDPLVKHKIRSLMMEESAKRMMKKVPLADVVITNPVHLAIAIQYKQEEQDAPIVLAKGKDLVAEKIKEIAREHNIPIIEDKPLARLLYQKCEIGEEIAVELYGAVAEILAYIFKNKK